MEADLNEIVAKKQKENHDIDLDSVKGYDEHLAKHIKIETKSISKNTEFKVVLDKMPRSNHLDVKVGESHEALFDIMSCISFKGTQYKEYKFIRQVFSNFDEGYFPKMIKIPVSFTFNAFFEVSLDSAPPVINLDLSE